MMGETVPDESQLALLHILLDRIHQFVLGDLQFSIAPTRDLNDHIEDVLFLVGE